MFLGSVFVSPANWGSTGDNCFATLVSHWRPPLTLYQIQYSWIDKYKYKYKYKYSCILCHPYFTACIATYWCGKCEFVLVPMHSSPSTQFQVYDAFGWARWSMLYNPRSLCNVMCIARRCTTRTTHCTTPVMCIAGRNYRGPRVPPSLVAVTVMA